MAGEEGFEPSHPDPESGVLPLDDSPAVFIIRHKHLASQQYIGTNNIVNLLSLLYNN